MARVELTESIIQPGADGLLRPLTGATVQVNVRGGGAATVYAAETGGATVTNPLTTTNGRVDGWVDEGSYDLVVTYGASTVTHKFEAVKTPTGTSTIAVGTLTFGVSADTNLYRMAANILKTDDIFEAPTVRVLDTLSGSGAALVEMSGTIAATPKIGFFVAGDPQYRYLVSSEGKMEWGGGSVTRDTNLYRSAANKLKTDDTFCIGAAATILLGDAEDTNLYRSAANILKTDDEFLAVGNITARSGVLTQVQIGETMAGGPGFLFGSAADTNLYRSAADTLKTDDALIVTGAISIGNTYTASGDAAVIGYVTVSVAGVSRKLAVIL